MCVLEDGARPDGACVAHARKKGGKVVHPIFARAHSRYTSFRRARARTAVSSAPTRCTSHLVPVKRADMFVKMNDMPVNDIAIIPLVYRPRTAGMVRNLVAPLSGWDNDLWLLKDWYKS